MWRKANKFINEIYFTGFHLTVNVYSATDIDLEQFRHLRQKMT